MTKGTEMISSRVIVGILRHVLTAAGGGLIGNGLLTGDDLNAAVGAIATLVGIVLSVIEKQKSLRPVT